MSSPLARAFTAVVAALLASGCVQTLDVGRASDGDGASVDAPARADGRAPRGVDGGAPDDAEAPPDAAADDAGGTCGNGEVEAPEECDEGARGGPLCGADCRRPRFASLAMGSRHACGVDVQGTAHCWGASGRGQADPPPMRAFAQLAVAFESSCALTRDSGALVCWGVPPLGLTDLARWPDPLADLAVSRRVYAVSRGNLIYWSDTDGLVVDIRDYVAVSAVNEAFCGLHSDGSVTCDPSTTPTAERARAVAVGLMFACVLRLDGSIACWTRELGSNWVTPRPPEGRFVQLAVGDVHACARDAAGEITCWGDNELGQSAAPPGSFVQVAAGGNDSCALRSDGSLVCWGGTYADPLGGAVQAISVHTGDVCVVRADGTLRCPGFVEQPRLHKVPPGSSFRQVACGLQHCCALRAEDDLLCWGTDTDGQLAPPAGRFNNLVTTDVQSCALDEAGLPHCWGGWRPNDAPPARRLVQLTAGGRFVCGLTPEGAPLCWGEGAPTGADAGPFIQIAAGPSHVCGLLASKELRCWGSNDYGESAPPAGTFEQVSGSCALTAAGRAVCWGASSAGALDEPPPHRWLRLATYGETRCGIRAGDRQVVCWGATVFNQPWRVRHGAL